MPPLKKNASQLLYPKSFPLKRNVEFFTICCLGGPKPYRQKSKEINDSKSSSCSNEFILHFSTISQIITVAFPPKFWSMMISSGKYLLKIVLSCKCFLLVAMPAAACSTICLCEPHHKHFLGKNGSTEDDSVAYFPYESLNFPNLWDSLHP